MPKVSSSRRGAWGGAGGSATRLGGASRARSSTSRGADHSSTTSVPMRMRACRSSGTSARSAAWSTCVAPISLARSRNISFICAKYDRYTSTAPPKDWLTASWCALVMRVTRSSVARMRYAAAPSGSDATTNNARRIFHSNRPGNLKRLIGAPLEAL